MGCVPEPCAGSPGPLLGARVSSVRHLGLSLVQPQTASYDFNGADTAAAAAAGQAVAAISGPASVHAWTVALRISQRAHILLRHLQHLLGPRSLGSAMAARRGFLRGGALLLAGAGGFAAVASTALALSDSAPPRWIHDRVPPRQEQLRKLSQGTAASPYDVLIIGGACPARQLQGERRQPQRRRVAACGRASSGSRRQSQAAVTTPWAACSCETCMLPMLLHFLQAVRLARAAQWMLPPGEAEGMPSRSVGSSGAPRRTPAC